VLAAARADRLEPAWHLALYGLRRGEIAGLKWDAIDFGSRTLTISLGRVTVDWHAVETTPKTARSHRTLPLTDDLVLVLHRAFRQQESDKVAAGKAYRSSGFVVVNEVGGPLRPETLTAMGWACGSGRRASYSAARCSAYLRHAPPFAGRSDRGDISVARSRDGGLHDADLRAFAG
jgi:integrase